MKKIDEIDQNLKVPTTLDKEDIHFYDCLGEPFTINGVICPENEQDSFRRMPQEVADATNEGAARLNLCTAGGRVRFRTNSPYVAIHVEMLELGKMPHFPFTGSIGLDLYEWRDGREYYVKSFVPPMDIKDGYESIIEFEEDPERERELIVNMPLYTGVRKLYIGLKEGALVETCRPYRYPVPVVYYGSSITQGGCASRPGNSYQSMISQKLNCDYINLGFSGSARAEAAIRRYISGLTMSVFVYDYDHNAPTVDFLKNTHQTMFEEIRAVNPTLPIILVSRPAVYTKDAAERFAVVKKTYDDARAKGDDHVYLIDGRKMVEKISENWSVDGVHPTDLGFFAMAETIGAVLKAIFEGMKE